MESSTSTTRSQNRRSRIFDRGVAALRNVVSVSLDEDRYACPLCMRAFTRQHLEQGFLSLEHVPPRSMGGRPLVLTCVDCNSGAGHTIDAAAHRRAEMWRFARVVGKDEGSYSAPLRMKIKGEKLTVRATLGGATNDLRLDQELNNPESLRRLREALQKHASEGTWREIGPINLGMLTGFHDLLSRLSDLKTAYLLAFATFGYRYAFSKQLEPVRRQLANPEHEILPRGFWIFMGWDSEEDRTLSVMSEPFHHVFVQIDRVAVILPGLDPPSDPWTELVKGGARRIQFTGTRLEWPRLLPMVLDFPASSHGEG